MNRDDLVGQTFGLVRVVRYLGNSYWLVACVCGRQKRARQDHLRIGAVVSCGCRGSRSSGPPPDPVPGATWVQLTQGRWALVDDVDAIRVSQHRWYLQNTNGVKPYAGTSIKRKMVLLHVFIMGAAPAGKEIDHRDGDGLNCRRGNLRFATRGQNLANRLTTGLARASRFRGVSRQGEDRWVATVWINGRRRTKTCRREEDAARAYNDLARLAYGEFARPNTVPA